MNTIIYDQIHHCEVVMALEKDKVRPHTTKGCHTWRYQLARGVRAVLIEIMHRQKRQITPKEWDDMPTPEILRRPDDNSL